MSLFCYCIFAWVAYCLCADLVDYFKLENSDLYRFKVLKGDEAISRNSVKHCCFFLAYICVLVTLSLSLTRHKESWFVVSGHCGYLLYRVWTLVHKWQSSPGYAHYFCFPLFNVSSSFLILSVTLLLEGYPLLEFFRFLLIHHSKGLNRQEMMDMNYAI